MKKKIVLLSMCALLLFASGCGHKVELKDGKEVAASIKGKKITAEELFDELKGSYGSTTIINMIDAFIANKEVETTDDMKKDAKDQIAQMKTYYEQNGYTWDDVLANYGYTTDDALIDEYVLKAKKETVVKNYLATKVTDDEMQKYYDKEIYGDYTVKHILISPDTTDDMTDDQKNAAEEKALKTAKNIIKKLNDGEKWATLVKKYSDDTATVEKEGLIENFTKGDVVDEFFNATLGLENNKYTTTPVESSYGYHIILKISNTDKPELSKVKDKVTSAIVENKLTNDENLYTTTWVDVRKSYDLSFGDTDLEKAYNKTIKK